MNMVTPDIAQLMFQSSGDCLWMVDLAGDRLYTNRAIEKILGYTIEEVMQTSPLSLIHPEDENRLVTLFRRCRAQRTSWNGEVFRWRAKDGSYRWLESIGNPVFDDDGEVLGFCGADRDITQRLEQERRVAESERIFRATFENAGVGIAQIGIDGRWLRVNQTLCSMLGYTEAEMRERDCLDLTHPDEMLHDLAQGKRLLAGEIPTYIVEKRYIRKDGSMFWAAATSSIVRDSAGRPDYCIAIIRDITEQRDAVDGLRQSEQDYRTMFEHSHDALLLIDPAEATVVAANDRAAELYARSAEDLIGMRMSAIVRNYALSRSHMERVLAGEPPVMFDNIYRTGDGSEVEVEVVLSVTQYGGRTLILNTNRDVTERNRLQRALAENERRFRLLVEHGYDLILIVDAQGIARYVAGAVMPNLGYTAEEVQGQDILEWVHEEERADVRYAMGRIAETENRGRLARLVRVRNKQGAWRLYEAATVNMLGVAGVDGIVIIAHDVTEQHELEERLEQQRRVDSLGRAAATVAHEINNALMAIQPAAEVLARKYASDPGVARFAGQVLAGVQRGKRVTQKVLRFARPAEPSRQTIGMQEWIAAITPEMRDLAGTKVDLQIVCNDSDLKIDADRDQLHQLITNLMVNARDAMHGRGAIEVTVRRIETEMLEISVRDDGPGIPETVLPRLFEPLFTTKSNGTGIGLPLCRQIATAHGGSITIESEVGVGTVARVQLPAIPPAEPATRKALIVEDDEGVAFALRFMLEEAGYAVEWTSTANGVVDRASNVALMLIDVQLGEDDGRKVFAELRRQAIDVPVIMMSGRTRMHPRELDAHATFLAKPFDAEELASAALAIA